MKEKIVSVELTPLYVPFKEFARKAMGEGEGGIGMVHPSEEESSSWRRRGEEQGRQPPGEPLGAADQGI